jgi:hypothetical protein
MLKTVYSIIAVCAIVSSNVWAQLPVKGKSGATIDQLIKDKTLVTIVLKSNHTDINARLLSVDNTVLNYKGSDGNEHVFAISSLKEVRVQTGKYREEESVLDLIVLSRDEKAVIQRAGAKATEIFNQLKASMDVPKPLLVQAQAQNTYEYILSLRMSAALVMALSGNNEGKVYLEEMMLNSDVDRAITAASFYIYLDGEVPNQLIKTAFTNGDRIARATAARIVGLTNNTNFNYILRKMSQDPSPEIYPSAIRALGLLGDSESIEQMYKGLATLSQPKAEAAIYALAHMENENLIDYLYARYRGTKGIEKLRILRLLYLLGDDDAINTIRDEGLRSLSYNKAFALTLAENSDWDGVNWIREYMNEAIDPNMENLFFQGYAAKAIYETTPNEATKILQELVRITPTQIYARGRTKDEAYKTMTAMFVHSNTCSIMGSLGDKKMMTVLSTKLHDENILVSLAAADAIVKIITPDYRELSNKSEDFMGTRETLLQNFFK